MRFEMTTIDAWGTDIISMHPEKFISHLDAAIAKLERVKNFAIDYQKSREEE